MDRADPRREALLAQGRRERRRLVPVRASFQLDVVEAVSPALSIIDRPNCWDIACTKEEKGRAFASRLPIPILMRPRTLRLCRGSRNVGYLSKWAHPFDGGRSA